MGESTPEAVADEYVEMKIGFPEQYREELREITEETGEYMREIVEEAMQWIRRENESETVETILDEFSIDTQVQERPVTKIRVAEEYQNMLYSLKILSGGKPVADIASAFLGQYLHDERNRDIPLFTSS